MPRDFLLEIAVTSLQRAMAAERAGAGRLELCADLESGGLTPNVKLIRQVRSAVKIPIHVLVRPRAGDYVYASSEFAQMKEAIAAIRGENVQGIVAGVLVPDGSVDKQRTGNFSRSLRRCGRRFTALTMKRAISPRPWKTLSVPAHIAS